MSVLEKKYVEADRPYSVKELEVLKNDFKKKFHLGETFIYHPKCYHGYLAKIGGKKEKEYQQSKCQERGNCSVCWKYMKTPKRLQRNAQLLVEDYEDVFFGSVNNTSVVIDPELSQEMKTYDMLQLYIDYYTWLYKEFNPTRGQKQIKVKDIKRD